MWTIERLWRLFATGLLYVIFGICSVALAVTVVLPLALIGFATPNLRIRVWRKIIQLSFTAFVGLGQLLGVFHVRFTNVEALNQSGQLIIANHPTLLDVVILISKLPDVECVIKRQLSSNPFVAFQVWLANYIQNDKSEELIRECVDRLNDGKSVILFPEGTRTNPGQKLRLLRGAARVALSCKAPLRPVLICCSAHSLGKGDSWYKIPPHRIEYLFDVGPCFDLEVFKQSDLPDTVVVRRLTLRLESWFTEKLRHRCTGMAVEEKVD